MEIVTEPQLHSPEGARQFFEALRQLLVYLGVSDGKLQEGSMRADVNVSLALTNGAPGTKVEIKNLNSFRSVKRALAFELERQREALANGKPIFQETRGWSEERGVTISQRTKEYAHDYRYFPEPDLPPLILTSALVDELEVSLPELPSQRLDRLQQEYALSAYTAGILTDEKELSDFFEAVLRSAPALEPVTVANWVTGDLARLVKDSSRPLSESPLSPDSFGRLLPMVQSNAISGSAAKNVLEVMFERGEDPRAIVDREDLGQIVDANALEALVQRVLDDNPQLGADYRRGKTNVLNALVGKVMATTKGKASPQLVTEILQRRLAGDG
jgi:aspartyl-tRNA(Asn)/glutamyl-tRNA(Gln) amidotransferase subunit B